MSEENREVSEKLGPQICSGSSHKEIRQELEVSHCGNILVKRKTPQALATNESLVRIKAKSNIAHKALHDPNTPTSL